MSTLISIQSKISELQRQADAIRTKEFQSTVTDICKTMLAYGITLADIQRALAAANKSPQKKTRGRTKATANPVGKSKLAGSKVEPKYRGPENQLWTGRGVMPKWLAVAIANGRSRDDFLISKQD